MPVSEVAVDGPEADQPARQLHIDDAAALVEHAEHAAVRRDARIVDLVS
ncbi:hypothetical protein [Microbacterium sp. NPDC087665]